MIERNLLARADRARGRFRWFLAAALNDYCANQLRADTAGKRVPAGVKLVSLAEGLEAGAGAAAHDGPAAGADGAVAAHAFDVAWAREAMAEALRRMRDECVACSRADLWQVFEWRVLGPALDDAAPVGYAELVQALGYATPKAAANALVTAKRRFEQALRSVIAEYVGDDEELELELAGLGDVLASAAQLERSDGARQACLPASSQLTILRHCGDGIVGRLDSLSAPAREHRRSGDRRRKCRRHDGVFW